GGEEGGRARGGPPRAGGGGPRGRAQPATLPEGRAALEPRCQAARRDACGDHAHSARSRRNDDLCDTRPDRGDDDGRPSGGDEARRPPPGPPPPPKLTPAPPP